MLRRLPICFEPLEDEEAMTKYIWTVLTNAANGEDEAFNRWYDEVHLADWLKVPGIVSAQRFKLAPSQVVANPGNRSTISADFPHFKYRYLSIYNIETDDLKGALEEVLRRVVPNRVGRCSRGRR
jgi:hypothetical protein